MTTTLADRVRTATACPVPTCGAPPGERCHSPRSDATPAVLHHRRIQRYHREHPVGGPRPGSGRPPKPEGALVQVAGRVPADVRERFEAWCAERELTVSQGVARVVGETVAGTGGAR